MIEVIFVNKKKYSINKKAITDIAKKIAIKEKKLKGAVELVITDNNEIKKLNKEWRGVNQATDVLAFAWNENSSYLSDQLGQIFISYPKILSQAKQFGVSSKEEFLRMFVHGLLHLAGYDHKKEKEAKKMFNIQEKIISEIKI